MIASATIIQAVIQSSFVPDGYGGRRLRRTLSPPANDHVILGRLELCKQANVGVNLVTDTAYLDPVQALRADPWRIGACTHPLVNSARVPEYRRKDVGVGDCVQTKLKHCEAVTDFCQ